MDEGSSFFESIEKAARFDEKDEEKTSEVDKDNVFRNISSFLNELKDFLRDNTHYDLSNIYQGLKGITELRHGITMAQQEGSTKGKSYDLIFNVMHLLR